MRCMSESVGSAWRAYRVALDEGMRGVGYRGSESATPAEAYLHALAFHEQVHERQKQAQPELSAAVGQLEAGIAAIQGIIRAKGLTPSRLNDMVEGLHGHESLVLNISMLREVIGPPSEQP